MMMTTTSSGSNTAARKRTSTGGRKSSSKNQKIPSKLNVIETMTLDNNNQCRDNANAAYLAMYGMQDVGMTNTVQPSNFGATGSATMATEKASQAKQTTNEPDILSLVLSYKKCDLLRDPEIIRFLSSIR